VEDISDKFAGIAVWFIACFAITIFLDAIFGMPPERPFVDYGWIWILKPIVWSILLMWATMGKYKKHSDEAMGRKALEEISKMKNEAIDKMAKSMLVSYAIGKEIMFKSKGLPEDEVFKGLLEDIKVICKKENVPDEWSIEVTEAFKRKVEEYRSMDEKHSTEMIKLIMKELQSARGKVSEESR